MKPKEKYVLDGGNVIPVYDVGGGWFVIATEFYDATKYKLYDNRMDAMYDKLVNDLQTGKPIENYRSSKYYKYYIDRLKKENPEFVI